MEEVVEKEMEGVVVEDEMDEGGRREGEGDARRGGRGEGRPKDGRETGRDETGDGGQAGGEFREKGEGRWERWFVFGRGRIWNQGRFDLNKVCGSK